MIANKHIHQMSYLFVLYQWMSLTMQMQLQVALDHHLQSRQKYENTGPFKMHPNMDYH